MITNPSAVRILCYGDSNTHGQKPDRTGRYAADIRWTGLLQNILGEEFEIIEEGLGSRTTDLDYDKKPGRNGKTYLAPCLHSHNPIDTVVVMLGTNDLKIEYSRKAEDIAQALTGIINDIRNYGETPSGNPPNILLVSPIEINHKAEKFAEYYTGYYDESAAAESQRLAHILEKTADTNQVFFVNAASVAQPGIDGIHLNESSQQPLASITARTIQEIYEKRN